MLFDIYIHSTLDTLLTGLWTDEPCNADGDFLIVPQKGSKSSSSERHLGSEHGSDRVPERHLGHDDVVLRDGK